MSRKAGVNHRLADGAAYHLISLLQWSERAKGDRARELKIMQPHDSRRGNSRGYLPTKLGPVWCRLSCTERKSLRSMPHTCDSHRLT